MLASGLFSNVRAAVWDDCVVHETLSLRHRATSQQTGLKAQRSLLSSYLSSSASVVCKTENSAAHDLCYLQKKVTHDRYAYRKKLTYVISTLLNCNKNVTSPLLNCNQLFFSVSLRCCSLQQHFYEAHISVSHKSRQRNAFMRSADLNGLFAQMCRSLAIINCLQSTV